MHLAHDLGVGEIGLRAPGGRAHRHAPPLDDIRLRDTSVLSPRWVTSGVYEILNRRELAEQNGEFVEANLADWLPEAQYPVEKHAFLIDLMRRFSMCIEYDASSERYLIPDLLPKNTPMAVLDMFRPDSCINLEFRYELLPEGLIPRFIARTHLRSEGQPRWRSGVVLALQDIAKGAGLDWDGIAAQLKQQGRLHLETY